MLRTQTGRDDAPRPCGAQSGVEDINELNDVVATAFTCCTQLRRTLDDILDFDAIEQGKLTVNVVPFAARPVVGAVLSQIQVQAREKGLTTRC